MRISDPGRACLAVSLMRRAALAAFCLTVLVTSAYGGPKVWQDATTGLAIAGYDPLAYYTDGNPRVGREEYELHWGGAVWRFLNSGNRAAFERDPGVYAPRFAGYDPYVIANGKTTPGQPAIWVRDGDSIFLFFNAAHKHLWLENRETLLAQAKKNWPALSDTLPDSLGE